MGFPVTTPGEANPCRMVKVSMIHAMTWASVYTSGAGMSFSGPMMMAISFVYRRVMRSSSCIESALGSTSMPPLAPPYGRFTTPHFQVIHAASAFTSSSVTCG